jgi:hypothetical protein
VRVEVCPTAEERQKTLLKLFRFFAITADKKCIRKVDHRSSPHLVANAEQQ